MSFFAWWVLTGVILTTYCFWLAISKDCMGNGKNPGLPDVIKLPDLLLASGIFLLGVGALPMTAIFAIGFTWEWAKLGDVVVWRRKPKDDVADLEKKARKLGFSLEPKNIKGLDD